jgi:hypothetical protein
MSNSPSVLQAKSWAREQDELSVRRAIQAFLAECGDEWRGLGKIGSIGAASPPNRITTVDSAHFNCGTRGRGRHRLESMQCGVCWLNDG